MSDLRTAAQQALEALEHHGGNLPWNAFVEVRKDLRDALAQQAEPQGCATEEDCTKQPWCRIRGECQRKQAEPLNLSDPAIQKRLAAQWGYVPAAAQDEPVACPCGDRRVDQCPGEWEPGCDLGSNAKYALAQQAEPTRSQQMVAAGFKPRDRRLECDECGGKFTAQMLPIHKCAQQDEPVEPVAQFDLNTMPGQADAHLRALLRYTENFYATAIEHGMRAGPTANAIAHVERAGKALHQIVHAQAKMLEPAQPVEPVARSLTEDERAAIEYFALNPSMAVLAFSHWLRRDKSALVQQAEPDHESRAELAEQQVVQLAEERDHYRNLWQKAQQAEPAKEPVAWECRAGGLKPLTQRQYDAQTVATKRHYTRIAPPRRTMVPLTEEEILAAVGWERAAMYMKLAPNFPVDEAKKETLTNARAVEKASWEKNHG